MAKDKEKSAGKAKNDSLVKTILIPALALLLIAGVSSFLLAMVNSLTAPVIAEREKEETAAAMALVMADAESFSDAIPVPDGQGNAYYEAKDASGGVIGYVFTTSGTGYGGEISVMTGVDAQGLVTGVQLLSINETPGLGMRAQGEDFLSQYEGKSGTLVLSKTASGDEIQALTGATITSKAVTAAVNTALSQWALITGEGA